MEIANRIFRAIASAALEFAANEERMEAVWEWAESRANDTETHWDDTGVAALKGVWPTVIDMLDQFLVEEDEVE